MQRRTEAHVQPERRERNHQMGECTARRSHRNTHPDGRQLSVVEEDTVKDAAKDAPKEDAAAPIEESPVQPEKPSRQQQMMQRLTRNLKAVLRLPLQPADIPSWAAAVSSAWRCKEPSTATRR